MPGPTQLLASGALAALLVGCAASPAGLAPARSDSPAPRDGATALAQTTPAGDYSRPLLGRLTFTFGERQLDGALAPTDEPQAFGVEYSRLSAGGPLGFELGFQFADDQARGVALPGGGAGTVDRLQSEFFAGLRAEGGEGTVHPHLGLGATWLTNDTRVRSAGVETRGTDSGLGAYGHLGLLFDLSRAVHVSIDGRMTFLTGDFDEGADSDYAQVSVGLGVRF